MTQGRTFASLDELRAAVGEELGTSDWLEVDQKRIDLFAEATGDHQWIHVDPEKAATGPFGTTIAHGYLTLSLIPQFTFTLLKVEGVKMGVNYGVNKVRFPSPSRSARDCGRPRVSPRSPRSRAERRSSRSSRSSARAATSRCAWRRPSRATTSDRTTSDGRAVVTGNRPCAGRDRRTARRSRRAYAGHPG